MQAVILLSEIPIGWLVAGLWALTLTLAGSLGKAIYAKIGEMSTSLKELSACLSKLMAAHARVDQKVDDYGRRLGVLEDHPHDRR